MIDQISMAFLVLLQRLTPAERAVLLLRDVFDRSGWPNQDVIKRWRTADAAGHASAAVRSAPKLGHAATDTNSSAGRSGECNDGREACCIRVAPVDTLGEPQMSDPHSAPILPKAERTPYPSIHVAPSVQSLALPLSRCVRHADSFTISRGCRRDSSQTALTFALRERGLRRH